MPNGLKMQMKPAKAFNPPYFVLSLYKTVFMKTIRYIFITSTLAFAFSSCSLFNKPKYGCGDNGGRNVGAEKVLDGSAPKKAKKFKA